MKCYLVRHGKDDDSVRGGCSDAPLTEQGIEQVNALANDLASNLQLNISRIFSSDLFRAKQTAEIISKAINVPVVYLPQFREVNNGVLAGMKNTEALKKYPGLFWKGKVLMHFLTEFRMLGMRLSTEFRIKVRMLY